MRRGWADTSTIEIDHSALLVTREDHALPEPVSPLLVDESGLAQKIQRVTQVDQVSSQVCTGSKPDAQTRDQSGIAQTPLIQVLMGLVVLLELQPIESGGLTQQVRCAGGWDSQFHFQMGHRLSEGEMPIQLHKTNQVTAAPAAVAIEQMLPVLT